MNEKISCGIAQDLMPLVIDDACGEESRQAVENQKRLAVTPVVLYK